MTYLYLFKSYGYEVNQLAQRKLNQWNTIAFIIQLETRKFNLTEGNTTIDMFSSRQKLMFTTNRDFLPIQGNKKTLLLQ